MHDLKHFIRRAAREQGFQRVGFARAESLNQEAQDLQSWLKSGHHGSMAWMERRQAERTDPGHYCPQVRTIVSLAMNYYTEPREGTATATATATVPPRWSIYAWGDDYHRLIKKRLKGLLSELKEAYPQVQGIACVDTSPVMEKVWAQRAGLGWQGKHTNLITKDYGSWVFLAELLLDVSLEPDPPFDQDLCGSCTACLDACPTGALTEAYQLDARRCISYLTIEHRGEFSEQEAQWLNGWIYGCDICQQVCPWNISFAQPAAEPAFAPRQFLTQHDWSDWQDLNRVDWDELLRGSAARRPGYDGLRRNIGACLSDQPGRGREEPDRDVVTAGAILLPEC